MPHDSLGSAACSRRRRRSLEGPNAAIPAPPKEDGNLCAVLDENVTSMPSSTNPSRAPHPAYDDSYLQPRPNRVPKQFYQQPAYQSQSSQYIPYRSPQPVYGKPAATCQSSLNLSGQAMDSVSTMAMPSTSQIASRHPRRYRSNSHLAGPYRQEQRWQSSTKPRLSPDMPVRDTPNDCPIARGMTQGAAACDRAAAWLNDVLAKIDADGEGDDQELEELVRDGYRGRSDAHAYPPLRPPIISTRSAPAAPAVKSPQEGTTGIFNFKKSWLYGNSRLPPYLPPLRVYMPAWRLLCEASKASLDVYRRPSRGEREDYIDAQWRNGKATKAMILTSKPIDDQNLIVFAIRGSQKNLIDWAVNFTLSPTAPIGFLDDDGNACHSGFLGVAQSMVKPVARRLRELLEQDPSRSSSSLLITGHSAGGAVASLLYMHMLSTSPHCASELTPLTGVFKRVHCVTFGAPPVSLMPLQKPARRSLQKSVFLSFANEGDLVVRADLPYMRSLAKLIVTPAPETVYVSEQPAQKPKKGGSALTLLLKKDKHKPEAPKKKLRPPKWAVPPSTLSNAGHVVVLREQHGRHRSKGVEAVMTTDDQLRGVIFGDPTMHYMALYKQRIDDLAIAAVTGR
ncbi:hypothetical protein MBLNU230_g4596t1 [Neophaeotheca triangularis]